ncbi:MAG: hypothetical protein WCO56_07305 [Verrucomicrobiota bacterium]
MNHQILQLRDPKEEVRRILYSMGFIAKDHILLAEKLLAQPPTEEFERVIKTEKHVYRELHLRTLRHLVLHARDIDMQLDELYGIGQKPVVDFRASAIAQFRQVYAKTNFRLATVLTRFAFNWTALEDMAMVADHIGQKIQVYLPRDGEPPRSFVQDTDRQRQRCALEELVRMPAPDYCHACDCLRTALKAVPSAQDAPQMRPQMSQTIV